MTEKIFEEDSQWMKEALQEASNCILNNEVPVGAILVFENKIIARGGNLTLTNCDPTAHAEVVTLRAAAKVLENHRLLGTTLYVTLEPCAMCAGAIVQARISRLVYGAKDPKAGAIDSHFGICNSLFLNHEVEIMREVLSPQCSGILQDFFTAKREKKSKR